MVRRVVAVGAVLQQLATFRDFTVLSAAVYVPLGVILHCEQGAVPVVGKMHLTVA